MEQETDGDADYQGKTIGWYTGKMVWDGTIIHERGDGTADVICEFIQGPKKANAELVLRALAALQPVECPANGEEIPAPTFADIGELTEKLTAANATIADLRGQLAHFRHDYAALHSAIQMQNRTYAAELEEVKRERDEARREAGILRMTLGIQPSDKIPDQKVVEGSLLVDQGSSRRRIWPISDEVIRQDAKISELHADLATARKELETERAAREGSQGAVELLRKELAQARTARQEMIEVANIEAREHARVLGELLTAKAELTNGRAKYSSLLTCAQGLAERVATINHMLGNLIPDMRRHDFHETAISNLRITIEANATALADFKSKSETKPEPTTMQAVEKFTI